MNEINSPLINKLRWLAKRTTLAHVKREIAPKLALMRQGDMVLDKIAAKQKVVCY